MTQTTRDSDDVVQFTHCWHPQIHYQLQVYHDRGAIFNAASRHDAETLLAQAIQEYAQKASALADWMEGNIPEGLTIFAFPSEHRHRSRTTNCLGRLNREIRRRSRVAVLFPNESSCLRLVSAIVMEISEEWQTGRVYIRLDDV